MLQASQQIMELQEASQIGQGLTPTLIGRDSATHDMKAIVKTWRFVRPQTPYSHLPLFPVLFCAVFCFGFCQSVVMWW